ncbi:hypothetical protein [Rhodospirillum sp. A1_3_36]|uniref:hypothetical protein n=1 Tax=Rhodospirillum sp. A1_3_36 TaxID=3391666 RepID=UPI0039A4ACF5
MTVQLEFYQFIGLLVAFFGFVFGAGKLLLSQIGQRLDERFSIVEKATNDLRDLEKQFMQLKADLPVDYVRREDYVRGQSILEAKMDGLAIKLENAQLRGLNHG